MHLATDPNGPGIIDDTRISHAKISFTGKRKNPVETALKPKSKFQALKERITEKMPAWTHTVDNTKNPASAYSMALRKKNSTGPAPSMRTYK